MYLSRRALLFQRQLFFHISQNAHKCTNAGTTGTMSGSEGDVYIGTTERGLTRELQFPVPWGHIAAKAWGDPLGRPVLGLHGYLDNANTFDTLAPLLPKDLYFVCVDMPGHGHSSHLPPGLDYKYESSLVEVHRVILALGWTKFSIIGHSLGGSIGMMYSAVFSDSVEKVVLLDIFGPFYQPIEGTVERLGIAVESKLAVEKASQLPPRVYSKEQALDRLVKGNPFVTREDGVVLLERGTREVEGGYVFTRDLKLRNRTFFSLTPEQTEELVKGIKCPVLMLSATERILGRYDEERRKRFIPLFEGKSSQFTEIEVEGNHNVHLNNPKQVAPHISKFFTQDVPS